MKVVIPYVAVDSSTCQRYVHWKTQTEENDFLNKQLKLKSFQKHESLKYYLMISKGRMNKQQDTLGVFAWTSEMHIFLDI